MANHASHFVDSPVFIYDTGNNLITRTTVTGFGKDELYIEVTGGLEGVKPGTRLQMLIIHPTGASELNGTLKSVRQGIYEISIFGERQRDVRTSARRTINASAIISDMVSETGNVKISEPLQIMIENMSTTGILINTKNQRLEPGSLLQIEFSVHGKLCVLYGEVVREQVQDDKAHRFGCQLYFFE